MSAYALVYAEAFFVFSNKESTSPEMVAEKAMVLTARAKVLPAGREAVLPTWGTEVSGR
jgi:hypothetical protein